MNGAVFVSLSILCLLSVSSITGFIQVVKADGESVYVRADGSIDPPTAPISTIDNVTYIFTGNINDLVVVERDNIVVDGAGCTVNGVDLTGRSNVTIKNMNIEAFQQGIFADASAPDQWGIRRYPSYNRIIGNNITSGGNGIFFISSHDNIISGNNITNNSGDGIWFWHVDNTSVIGNNITANEWSGIVLMSAQDNIISGNNIADNGFGINTYWEKFDPTHTLGNRIYNNNFVNNSVQASIEPEPNAWDDGVSGNYWSDYNGTDTNHDGIGNTKDYVMDAYRYNVDRYPLMGMFSDFNATLDQHVTTVCNSTISDFQFNGTAITFDVTGVEGTTGFCRICVPTSLMNATYRVLVNGTEVSCNLLPCSNSTHSYLYFNYAHSTQPVIITIPEYPSFLILALFTIAILIAVIIYKKKGVKTRQRSIDTKAENLVHQVN